MRQDQSSDQEKSSWYGICYPFAETVTIMKEKADTPRPRKTAAKSTTTSAPKAAKTPKAETSVKKPRATKSTTSSRKKSAAPIVDAIGSDDIAVAAFLNWCQRRNQGLPDDALADWIMAENDMGLAN
jgi:hypothetical protein